MNKNFWLLIISVTFALLGLVSCEESDGIDEFANWKERNDTFIDSIANVAANNPTTWRKYKGWTLPPDAVGASINVQDYIYVRSITEGDSDEVIYSSDTITYSYRGKRIDGIVFDYNYTRPEFDPNFVTPVKSNGSVSSFTVGFATALLYMNPGDRWEVYIPYSLGYGSVSTNETLPAYSNLIFDVYVGEVIHPGDKKVLIDNDNMIEGEIN